MASYGRERERERARSVLGVRKVAAVQMTRECKERAAMIPREASDLIHYTCVEGYQHSDPVCAPSSLRRLFDDESERHRELSERNRLRASQVQSASYGASHDDDFRMARRVHGNIVSKGLNPTHLGNRVKDQADGWRTARAAKLVSAWRFYFYSLFARCPSLLGPPHVLVVLVVVARRRWSQVGAAVQWSRTLLICSFAFALLPAGRASAASSRHAKKASRPRRANSNVRRRSLERKSGVARERTVRHPTFDWLLCLVNRNS